jgi:coenzyme F420-0:L-glutamate ligase / coenzyme F420-1:gamma-L-glutamate ligase
MGETWREQLALDGQDEATVALRARKSYERIVGAPVAVIVCLYLDDLDAYPDPERQANETVMAIQSLGAAAQNMLLAAYAYGLDGGWMCAPLFCPDVVRAALDLPASFIPHALLSFGYAAKEPVRRPRRPLDELVIRYDEPDVE